MFFVHSVPSVPSPLGTRALRKILNIGAGLLPLVGEDFDADIVYNYDPLTSARNKIDSLCFGFFAGLIHDPHSDVRYATSENEINLMVDDLSIDLLLSISPFGFSLVTDWVHRKLKVGAQLLVVGNHANKWLTEEKLIAPGLKRHYQRLPRLMGRWEQLVEEKIRMAYPSHTSAMERSTQLDTFHFFIKRSFPSA